jgi:capsular polysaccharide biosynthesis protein
MEAFHLLGGNNKNYFHWMLDILPRLQVEPFASRRFTGPILFPSVRTAFQQDSLALLSAQPNPIISITDHEVVRVKSLHFVPNLVGYGFTPNPNLNSFFDNLKQRLIVGSASARRIYVSRKDSENRQLINEDEVISLMSSHGFEVIELSKMTLGEQASAFASATQIVAPHGAGLANLVFCGRGAAVCELQMNEYMPWFFRRLAGTRDLTYGCLIGQAEPSGGAGMWAHTKRWSAPVDRLRAVLDDPCFSDATRASVAELPFAGGSIAALFNRP